ncbi:MAG: hypothetical protein ACYDCQ_03565, partial [Dehalococcoidia bacterium]
IRKLVSLDGQCLAAGLLRHVCTPHWMCQGSNGKPVGGLQGGGNNDGGGIRIKGGHIIPVPPWQPLVGYNSMAAHG